MDYVYITQAHWTPSDRADDVFVATTHDEATSQFNRFIERRNEDCGGELVVRKREDPQVGTNGDEFDLYGGAELFVPSDGMEIKLTTYSVYVGA